MATTPYVSIRAVLEEAGMWQRQLGEAPAGAVDGANDTFTVDHKPLTDTDYDDELTVNDVTVYVEGEPVDVTSVDADTGTITLDEAPDADDEVLVDYSYSAIPMSVVSDIIDEAMEWVNDEMTDVATTPYTDVPKRVRMITRILAAGLLMSREFALQATEEQGDSATNKIKLAERLLKEYRTRLSTNGADAGEISIPRSTSGRRIFEQYDETEGRWGPLSDESFTLQGAE